MEEIIQELEDKVDMAEEKITHLNVINNSLQKKVTDTNLNLQLIEKQVMDNEEKKEEQTKEEAPGGRRDLNSTNMNRSRNNFPPMLENLQEKMALRSDDIVLKLKVSRGNDSSEDNYDECTFAQVHDDTSTGSRKQNTRAGYSLETLKTSN